MTSKKETTKAWGSAKPYVWTREHFLNVVLSGRKPLVRNQLLAEALAKIDRADFLPAKLKSLAYSDTELEIAPGVVVPSPLVLVELIEQLNLMPDMKLLELGVGGGFTTALLSYCIGQAGVVYGVERNQLVLETARQNLANYPQLKNYELFFKDGSDGLLAKAPFAGILVNFAYDEPPLTILEQLTIGGRMVLPLADLNINLYTRDNQEEVTAKLISTKRFRKVQYGVE